MFRHKRKPIRGEAVQFIEDGRNDNIIASWLGVHPKRVNEVKAVVVPVPGVGNRKASRGGVPKDFAGDYIIKAKDGLYVCFGEAFEDTYELEPEPEIAKPEVIKPEPVEADAPPKKKKGWKF